MSRIFYALILLPNNNPQNAVSAVKGNIGDNDAMKGTAGTFNPQQAEKSKPANPRKHRSTLAGAGIFAGLLGAVLWTADGHAQQAALVTTDAVVEQSFTQTIPIIGRLAARQSGVVAARIDGTVSVMRVQVGDRVTRGQVLAVMDTELLTLRVTIAEARLKTATAQLALASQAVERLRGLIDSAAVSEADYDDARQRHIIAQAGNKAADAEVGLAQLALAYAEIKAPFDGAITARLTEVGSYLQRGQAVARLVSDRQLEVEADVPYDRLSGIAAEVEVEVLLDNGDSHRATVRAIVPEENPRTRTRRVRFTIDFGADFGLDSNAVPLAAEQSVTVLIPAGAKRDIVSVHKDAIVQRGRDKIVFVVVDGVANPRTIRTGQASGARIEVLSGLAPGDLAVVRGNERLQPNQKVAATAAPTSTTPTQ